MTQITKTNSMFTELVAEDCVAVSGGQLIGGVKLELYNILAKLANTEPHLSGNSLANDKLSPEEKQLFQQFITRFGN